MHIRKHEGKRVDKESMISFLAQKMTENGFFEISGLGLLVHDDQNILAR